MPVSGFAVAYTAAGGVVLWSGIKGETISATFRGLLSGKAPATDQEPISGSTPSGGGGTVATATGSALADDALKYVGSRYVWGGSPGTTPGTDAGTDCSGFLNMCAGRDLGLAIPGYKAGAYTGSTHGPSSQIWLVWGGCTTIRQNQVRAGDLACYLTHIAIFTDAGQHCVSAYDTASGVIVTPLAQTGPTGEPLTCRRLNG